MASPLPEADPSLRALLPDIANGLVHASAGLAGPAGLVVAGICGSQGSGKTTLSHLLEHELARLGKRAVTLSLDDFYLPRADRLLLAQDVHPLCATRGVPGTHDMVLYQQTLDALSTAGPQGETRLPRFSKLDDDRMVASAWGSYRGRPDVVLFEGWCVGAEPLSSALLAEPLNALEASRDKDGTWRRWWNEALAHEYWPVWKDLAPLILIRVPGLESVIASRLRQEQGLAQAEPDKLVMDEAAVRLFVAHYERLTRHIWREMPSRAHLVIDRDDSFAFSIAAPMR